MKFEIKHRVTTAVLFSLECGSLKICVRAAVKAKTYLRGADLRGAYLRGADDKSLRATPEQAIENLDKVREIIVGNAKRLNMGVWHEKSDWIDKTCAEEAVCGTAHCLAGWLQVCATNPEIRKMDVNLAGILQAPVAAKMFFRGRDEVLTWLTDRAYATEAA